ncbi:MAG TPA: hypothetical protein VGX68_10385 [Thermoanaerobaculia bacterium]|jgi:hypothetical protein|nr:hypothetical protein [Thermoanaerobaculia bacterium]
MKYNQAIKLCLVSASLLLAAAAGCASGNAGTKSSASSAPQGPAFQVASMLSGTYQLRDGNSDVRLQIGTTGGAGSNFNLLATASGTYEGRDLHQQGVIRLVSEGPDVRMSVIPHFAPVTELSPDVNRFSGTELQAACSLYLEPDKGKWSGATLGPGTCVQAVTGAAGQWQVEILPGALRFIDVGTKQALVFQKTGDSVSR